MSNDITAKQLMDMLKYIPSNHNLMIIGDHGIGKSQITAQVYKTEDVNFITLFLGQMGDPGDLIGMPVVDTKKKNMITQFAKPVWWPEDESKPVVLFLDELNRANPMLLAAVMDLTLNRRLMGRSLPPGSRIISAINHGDQYQVQDLDPALYDRFIVVNLLCVASEWLDFAQKNGLHRDVIEFIKTKPDLLHYTGEANSVKTATPRGWHRVSDILNGIEQKGEKVDSNNIILQSLILGCVGKTAMTAFIQFLSSRVVITAQDILQDYEKVEKKIPWDVVTNIATLLEDTFTQIDLWLQKNDPDMNNPVWVNMFNNWKLFLNKLHDDYGGLECEYLVDIVNRKIQEAVYKAIDEKIIKSEEPELVKFQDWLTDHHGLTEKALEKLMNGV